MATTKDDVAVEPELAALNLEDKPDGPGAAAMLAAGIGIFLLGLFTVLSEMSEPIHDLLGKMDFGAGVGPLAGKTILGAIGFFASWVILHVMWRDKDVSIKKMFWIGLGLGVVGALLMFPPVFLAFA
jgi:hypothetical protein